jgi:hypothetical protein
LAGSDPRAGIPILIFAIGLRAAPNTALISTLIARQDAMGRRVARKINTFLAEHVIVAEAALSCANVARLSREKFGPNFVEKLVKRVAPDDPETFRTECGGLVADALANFDRLEKLFGPPPATRPPEEPRAVVHRSRTLAEARAQLAHLQTRHMDLQARIVPLRALEEPG